MKIVRKIRKKIEEKKYQEKPGFTPVREIREVREKSGKMKTYWKSGKSQGNSIEVREKSEDWVKERSAAGLRWWRRVVRRSGARCLSLTARSSTSKIFFIIFICNICLNYSPFACPIGFLCAPKVRKKRDFSVWKSGKSQGKRKLGSGVNPENIKIR